MNVVDSLLVNSANDLAKTQFNNMPLNESMNFLLVWFPFNALPKPLLAFCFNLVKSNLYNLYIDAQDTGWSDRGKMKELSDVNGRYVIAFRRPNEPSKFISHVDYIPLESDSPLGFLYYVCCMEDSYDDVDGGMNGDGKAPVIYWYAILLLLYVYDLIPNAYLNSMELQLTPEARNTGLGTTLMQIQEQTGKLLSLRKSMLTVFKKNEGAMRFYKRLGYTPDNISPSMCMSEKRAGRYSYEIMKKDL
ncbi:UNVERIFIED_CONTAM: hypothetical protein HDU68_010218 [Siphonaria sp. JEL0065]|nr:hypothetical protein HDU68_010218 [Siphonaria sp. JEL0065]